MERLRHGMIAVNRQAGTAKTGRNSQPGSEGNSTRMLRFVVSDGLLRALSRPPPAIIERPLFRINV